MAKIILTITTAIGLAIALGKIEEKINKIHIRFFLGLLKVLIFIIAGFSLFSSAFQIETTGNFILKSSSIIVAVLTYIAQKTLGNVVSGLSISISKPFQIGDKVKIINGSSVIAEGIVSGISLRHTIITTYDKQTEIIPNSIIDDSVVVNTNYTSDVGRFFEVQIGYKDNIDKAIEILQKICERETLVTKVTQPLLASYNESGVTIKATVFTKNVDDNFIACSNIRKKLLVAYAKNGITIPYNTITVEKQPEP